MYDGTLILGGIDLLVGRSDEYPDRFLVGRLDLFSIINEGDVHRGHVFGLDGVILHRILNCVDDVPRLDGLDHHLRSLREGIRLRIYDDTDDGSVVLCCLGERHRRHVDSSLRLLGRFFLRGLRRLLFLSLSKLFPRVLHRGIYRLLCRFRQLSLRDFGYLFLRRHLDCLIFLRLRSRWFFRRLRLSCLSLVRLRGRWFLRGFFREYLRKIFLGFLRKRLRGFSRNIAFSQFYFFSRVLIQRHGDG